MSENNQSESIVTEGKIRVDFVSGVRICIPPKTPQFRYKFSDADTGELYDSGEAYGDPVIESALFTKRKYYVRWNVELGRNGKWFFSHTFDATGKRVFIDLSPGAIGDSAAWLPAAIAFTRKWNCNTIVCMRPEHIPLYAAAYPEIRFIAKSEESPEVAARCYAYYRIAVHGYGDVDRERMDFRENNLIKHADMILGVDSKWIPPQVVGTNGGRIFRVPYRTFTMKYVAIATRASRKCKEWNHPDGWGAVVSALRDRGFTTVCIDADNRNLPSGAIDHTGNLPLAERIDVLSGASFFIGLPSGLSWLAWACRKPVVMISGFTDDYVEFPTLYRVSPPSCVCHGCWRTADQRQMEKFDSCYFDKNNECTRTITPEMVMEQINKLIKQENL